MKGLIAATLMAMILFFVNAMLMEYFSDDGFDPGACFNGVIVGIFSFIWIDRAIQKL